MDTYAHLLIALDSLAGHATGHQAALQRDSSHSGADTKQQVTSQPASQPASQRQHHTHRAPQEELLTSQCSSSIATALKLHCHVQARTRHSTGTGSMSWGGPRRVATTVAMWQACHSQWPQCVVAFRMVLSVRLSMLHGAVWVRGECGRWSSQRGTVSSTGLKLQPSSQQAAFDQSASCDRGSSKELLTSQCSSSIATALKLHCHSRQAASTPALSKGHATGHQAALQRDSSHSGADTRVCERENCVCVYATCSGRRLVCVPGTHANAGRVHKVAQTICQRCWDPGPDGSPSRTPRRPLAKPWALRWRLAALRPLRSFFSLVTGLTRFFLLTQTCLTNPVLTPA